MNNLVLDKKEKLFYEVKVCYGKVFLVLEVSYRKCDFESDSEVFKLGFDLVWFIV